MSIRIAGCAFVLAMLVGSCAQTPSKNPPSDSISKTGDNTEIPEGSLSTPSLPSGRIDDTAKNTVIEQIMAESGLNKMIEQLPAMVAMGFDQQQPPPIKRDEYEKFRDVLLQTFEADRIRKTIIDHLNEQYEPKRFSEFLTLIRTPLAQKMTALEMEANTPQAQQEMMQMGNIIMGQASPDRLELARRLDEATSATETALDMQMMMSEAIMTNMNKILPQAQRMTEAQLEQMLERIRLQSVFPARQYTQLSIVYMYRSVSDEELGQYIQLHESETARWGTALIRDAWMKVSEGISVDLAERMKNTFIQNNAL